MKSPLTEHPGPEREGLVRDHTLDWNRIMKTTWLSFALMLALLAGAGCRSPKIDVAPPTEADYPILAEIDRGAALDFDEDRVPALKRIARRPGLSPAVQLYLVNATYNRLYFHDSKVEMLVAIVNTPNFADSTRLAILKHLKKKIPFDSNHQVVLDAIEKRTGKPAKP